MKKYAVVIISLIFSIPGFIPGTSYGQLRTSHNYDLKKYLQDGRPDNDYNNWTTASEFGVTVTNIGILGEGWNNPNQPSSLYQQYNTDPKKRVSHFSYAGLWVGGQVGSESQGRVSSSIVDGVFDYGEEGFEFKPSGHPGDSLRIKSSIFSNRYYSPDAISHEDLVGNFDDLDTLHAVPNHSPLGVEVHLEAYNWNYTFANSFIILNYTVKNISNLLTPGGWTIRNLFAGIWMDCSVGNLIYTNYYEPGDTWTWYDNLDAFDNSPDENGYPLDIGYQYDDDGDNGWAQSYIGIKVLGSDVPRDAWDTYYRQWVWTSTTNQDYQDYFMPQNDAERYYMMQTNVQSSGDAANYYDNGNLSYNQFPNDPNSWIMLLSGGPFGTELQPIQTSTDSAWTLAPGDSVNIVFGIVAGFWNGSGMADTPSRRKNLRTNAAWALKAYNGEDTNGNGVLDPDEDTIVPNGKIDRYILPAPPPSPQLAVIPGDGEVTLYWNNTPLAALDPVSRAQDFEGFRIYGAKKTQDGVGNYSLLREYDLTDGIGYDTGLEDIRIYDKNGSPTDTTINGVQYQYRWTNSNLKNGWTDKNLYAVTSFDRGDKQLNLPSLESSINENRVYAIPGTPPVKDGQRKVGVYPNPYRARAAWDGFGERERLLWFNNLPERCTIRIYTLSGDLIDKIEHDASSYHGADVQGIQTGQDSKFAGGEHAWDLISKNDQAIASGLYLFTVENKADGSTQIGKFLVVK